VNKESEFFYLEKFKENYSDFPEGMVCLDEKPDFVIRIGSKFLGVEITHYYRETSSETKSPLQQKLATRRKIVDLAKSIYDAKNLPPLYVHVHFGLHFYCSEREVQTSAEKLVRVVEQQLSKTADEVFCRRDEIPLADIDLITVKKKLRGINLWTAPFGSFVPFVSPQRIQEMLDEKNSRCEKYRKKCDIIWLVIMMDRFQPSSFSMIPETISEHLYNHSFDSAFLFFYDYPDSQKPPIILQKL
jgi:hypothetical protein